MTALPRPKETAARLRRLTPLQPGLAIVLGSGFQSVATRLKSEAEIPYTQLPGFPMPGVPGHVGKLAVGHLGETPVALLCGRAHFYEGYSLYRITFPMRVLAEWGIQAVLLTNAAGAIHPALRPGDFMYWTDHINCMGANVLRGRAVPGRDRFLDLAKLYNTTLNAMLVEAARQSHLRLRGGVYLAVAGPTYETPAEIRAFAHLGADAVGMSSVPEAIVARQCGLAVAAVSCLTNLAAGLSKVPLAHADVVAIGERLQAKTGLFLERFAGLYSQRAGRIRQ
jgi:purine-nucleoside phosphorylase